MVPNESLEALYVSRFLEEHRSFKEIVRFKIVLLKYAFRPPFSKDCGGEAVDVSRPLRAVKGCAEEAGRRYANRLVRRKKPFYFIFVDVNINFRFFGKTIQKRQILFPRFAVLSSQGLHSEPVEERDSVFGVLQGLTT